jgi:SRSO17 transposase
VVEIRDGMPSNGDWLYVKKFSDKKVKYQISNTPHDTTLTKIRKVSSLRWSIEQNFRKKQSEFKSELGMTHFEDRTLGWVAKAHAHSNDYLQFYSIIKGKKFSLNIEDLSEKGKKIFYSLKSQTLN